MKLLARNSSETRKPKQRILGRDRLHTKFTFSIVDTINLKRFVCIDSEKVNFACSLS